MPSRTRTLSYGRAMLGLLLGLLLGACAARESVPSEPPPDPSRSTPAPVREVPVMEDEVLRELDPGTVEIIETSVARLRADHENWLGWMGLGMIYHTNELLPPARDCYEQAIALAPEQPRPYFYLALLQGQIGEADTAVATMQEAVERAEDMALVHWRLGFLQLEAGDAEAAAASFDRALAIDPDSEAALIGAGRAAQQLDRPEAAAEHFEKALGVGQLVNRGHTHRLLAGVYQRLGRSDEAERSLALSSPGDAIYDDPWASELVSLRASVTSRREIALRLMDGGREADALTLIEALATEAPDDPLALESLGVIYARLGRIDDALPVFERLVEEHPDMLAGPENLARALLHESETLRQAGEVDAAEASIERGLDHAERAIDLAPDRPRAHGVRGDLLRQAGRFGEAAEAYRQAMALDSRDPSWAAAVGRMELELENWAAAAEVLEPVTRQAPLDAQAWRNLGIAYLRLGQLDEAELALDEAHALAPGDPPLEAARQELAEQRAASSP